MSQIDHIFELGSDARTTRMRFENKASGNAILQASCVLQKGIAASLTKFVHHLGSEIVHYDQYVDVSKGKFYCRMEWSPVHDGTSQNDVIGLFKDKIVTPFQLNWNLRFNNEPLRMAIFVSKEITHLYSLITRCLSGQWNATIPLIIGNHIELRQEADRFGIPYYHLPIRKETKKQQEKRQLELLEEYKIDVIVLARYMQIITNDLISVFHNRIINIHHSMLPAFAGAKPYHQAYERGVKLIGATSHYVTEALDAGPIISQDTIPIDHSKTVKQLVNLGRDIETSVLTRAVGLHIDARVMVSGNRTILFD